MLQLKPNNYSPEMHPNREERDPSSKKSSSMRQHKEKQQSFQLFFFLLFLQKKKLQAQAQWDCRSPFSIKKKTRASTLYQALFFIEEVEVPGCAEKKEIFQPSGGTFEKLFFLHAGDKDSRLSCLSHSLFLFLLSLPVTSIFFGRERKACY